MCKNDLLNEIKKYQFYAVELNLYLDNFPNNTAPGYIPKSEWDCALRPGGAAPLPPGWRLPKIPLPAPPDGDSQGPPRAHRRPPSPRLKSGRQREPAAARLYSCGPDCPETHRPRYALVIS